jgi:hypothetical protein
MNMATELPDISELFKTIIEFLEYLNEYFSEELRRQLKVTQTDSSSVWKP